LRHDGAVGEIGKVGHLREGGSGPTAGNGQGKDDRGRKLAHHRAGARPSVAGRGRTAMAVSTARAVAPTMRWNTCCGLPASSRNPAIAGPIVAPRSSPE